MRSILLMALILGASSAVVAKESPLEVAKKFLKDTVPAPCATIAIGECDNGYCWGEKEAFVFQIKDETLANPFVRSFRPYTTDGETFTPTVRLENNADTETLTLELFQQAWAPALPDEDGIDQLAFRPQLKGGIVAHVDDEERHKAGI